MKININISISAEKYVKGQTVQVRKGKDWKLGVVQIASLTTIRVKLTSGVVTMVDAKDVSAIPATKNSSGGLPPTEKPTTDLGKAIDKRLAALGIEDAVLKEKLATLPYILSIEEHKAGQAKIAGYFPFPAGASTVTLLGGAKVSKEKFFKIMRSVGAGLTGKPSKLFGHTKGYARSRVDGTNVGDAYVTVDGFMVPSGWVEHYRDKYKIPLNIFYTPVMGVRKKVTVMYLAPAPLK